MGVVFLSTTTLTVLATIGALRESVEGLDQELSDLAESDGLDNNEQTESTLAIPNITQRDEPLNSVTSETAPLEEFAMKAEYRADPVVNSYWDLTGFGLNVSPGSEICREDNCKFEVEEGQLRPDFVGGYVFEGRLKVGVEEEGGTRSDIYNIRGELDRSRTFEQDARTTDFLNGKLKIGSGTLVGPAPIEYDILNGTLVNDGNEATLILQGERTQ